MKTPTNSNKTVPTCTSFLFHAMAILLSTATLHPNSFHVPFNSSHLQMLLRSNKMRERLNEMTRNSSGSVAVRMHRVRLLIYWRINRTSMTTRCEATSFPRCFSDLPWRFICLTTNLWVAQWECFDATSSTCNVIHFIRRFFSSPSSPSPSTESSDFPLALSFVCLRGLAKKGFHL
jgi:hypothetical protein